MRRLPSQPGFSALAADATTSSMAMNAMRVAINLSDVNRIGFTSNDRIGLAGVSWGAPLTPTNAIDRERSRRRRGHPQNVSRQVSWVVAAGCHGAGRSLVG